MKSEILQALNDLERVKPHLRFDALVSIVRALADNLPPDEPELPLAESETEAAG